MKKLLFIVGFGLVLLPGWAVAPHIIMNEGEVHHFNYALDPLVRQQVLTYVVQTDDGQPITGTNVAALYAGWFQNALNYIHTEQQKTELAAVLPILEFASRLTSYRQTQDTPAIRVIYTGDIRKYCDVLADGCFSGNTVFVRNGASQTALTHEIGHSLRLGDLYDSALDFRLAEYGNGIQSSIMNESAGLTCDDADGLINAIYVSLKHQYPQTADLYFHSLCGPEGGSFRNARQENRPMLQIGDPRSGGNYVYTYCKDGTLHSALKVRPFDLAHLVQTVRPEHACEVSPLPENKAYASKAYQVASFETASLLGTHPGNGSPDRLMLIPLTSVRGLFAEIQKEVFPGITVLRVLDNDNQQLYLHARLPEGYNLVHYEWAAKSGRVISFVYNPQQPQQNCYYLFYRIGRQEQLHGVAAGEVIECTEQTPAAMQPLLKKYQKVLSEKFPVGFSHRGSKAYDSYIQYAQEWDRFLDKYLVPALPKREGTNEWVSVSPSEKPN